MNKRLNDRKGKAYDIPFVLCNLMALFISVSIRFRVGYEGGRDPSIKVHVFWTRMAERLLKQKES
jgi:membrane protein DedA with SNARE-associated domain